MFNAKVRSIVAALAAMLVVSVGLTGIADANFKQSVSIHYNGDGFQGKVKSSKAKCLRDRNVTVYRHRASGDQELYMDTTDSQGRWNTGNSGQTTGRFYAAVDAGHGCSPIVSKTIRV